MKDKIWTKSTLGLMLTTRDWLATQTKSPEIKRKHLTFYTNA